MLSDIHQNGSKKHAARQRQEQSSHRGKDAGDQPAKHSETETLYDKACHLIESHKYREALGMLNAAAVTDPLRNLKGVCLLRMGQIEPAIRVLRNLVMQPGATWVRPGTPILHHVNYCTALLLGGHPTGCVELLAEVGDQQHPAVVRLRQAMTNWQRELSFWQRMQWWFGMEPNRPVRLDYPPGEYETAPVRPETPGQTTPPAGPRIAV